MPGKVRRQEDGAPKGGWTIPALLVALVVAIVLVAVVAPLASSSSATEPEPSEPEHRAPVLAFYYPWYGTPWVSGAWRHWNEAGHDPSHIDPVTGFRDIGATDHPFPDVYDSNDPAVLHRHLEEAKQSGIDGLVVSWWGRGTFEDNAFARLMNVADETGSRVKLTIYYEATPGFEPSRAVADITYILQKYGDRKPFLRIKGRPVVFVYSRAIFPAVFCLFERCPPGAPAVIDWKPVLAAVKARFRALFFADRLSTLVDLTPLLGEMGFDGVHLYNPNFDLSRQSPEALYSDVVASARRFDLLAATTVIPGYDDTHIGRANPTVRPRDAGELYRSLWQAAKESDPDMFLITTFNEWHEGTEIEHSYEYGSLYLQLTGELARANSNHENTAEVG